MGKKIKKYQKVLEDYLNDEAKSRNNQDLEQQVITDVKNNHFQLVEVGWYEKQFIYHVVFHFDIKENDKIWIFVNDTDILVAEELMKRGIPASDIVLGFHSPSVRAFTGFAVA